ncbi:MULTISPECIES: polyprenyl synthetase family protein [unclassified Rathayibacter]|uniref:polyprenyl synthetase family protein n=1 Tax=unclassified Rathayibacter TaxID=2609250 RepID=UPI000CE8EEE9|nr:MULTISPECIES: polyprenyl synthetase family protein [unclassified Rathayibacter]PPF21905.1 geranylgeranyl pyrophosphate synthase [Rathayibacter sp. AY1A7]PPF48141.1 geranylgeranyl pyrophosphate synthase [Rathayibacter sp. AY1A1]PPG16012.1 geranylgeranyl pyrophosphate synthase [Rathayibacter sp. AY1C6]PPG86258.1 geranylgeranyl pyrophosphate synthase [Rathayibacter sp. AY1H2]PPH01943.1 geranylgeranyl pyrophosphate synthase [Rathayibacter sp. AY1G9]
MNATAPVARRSPSLTAQLGLSERIFSSSSDRALARAIDAGLEQVEEGLVRQLSFADAVADVSTRYLLEAGGKRVRPMLTLLAASLGRGNTPQVLLGAQAIEITHLASLYHDDVMDEAEKRRGVPSAQTVWGNNVAILTGDLLFARANQLMVELGDKAIRLQADTFERLVLGQLHETVGPTDGEDPVEHYLSVLADKTGSLIAAAGRTGVAFSEAPEEYEEAMRVFGEKIGVAFQIVDDVIDLSPQPEETGKNPGTDIRAGVSTLPILRLRERASSDRDAAALLARIESYVSRSNDAIAHTEEQSADISDAIAQLRDHDVTAQTLAEAHRWADEAVAALAPLPDGSVRKALTRFADTVVERNG